MVSLWFLPCGRQSIDGGCSSPPGRRGEEGGGPSRTAGLGAAESGGPSLRAPLPLRQLVVQPTGLNFGGTVLSLSLYDSWKWERVGGSGPRHDAAEEACRKRRGRGAGHRGPELRAAALRPHRAPVRGPGGPPVSGGRDVLSVPGGENQRPPGEDRRSRIRQGGPLHPSASRLPGSAHSSGAGESGATSGSGVKKLGYFARA